MHVCVQVCMPMCAVEASGHPRGVVFQELSALFLRQCVSLGHEALQLDSAAGQKAPGIRLSPHSHSPVPSPALVLCHHIQVFT